MSEVETASTSNINHGDIALPPARVTLTQDEEWCVVEVDGEWRKIRFHDYDKIYKIPGLYEAIFYDVLRCSSPATIRGMLKDSLREVGSDPEDLRVLDLGAGNGMVGDELSDLGVRHLYGVDIIDAAAKAADRDRPEIYEDYFVMDMTDLRDADVKRFRSLSLNCLVSVAALGFGDIPPAAFANAYNLIETGGWVAFNIKSDFLNSNSSSGFANLVQRMGREGVMTIRSDHRYEHRLATTGDPLLYNAFIATKNRDVPADWEF